MRGKNESNNTARVWALSPQWAAAHKPFYILIFSRMGWIPNYQAELCKTWCLASVVFSMQHNVTQVGLKAHISLQVLSVKSIPHFRFTRASSTLNKDRGEESYVDLGLVIGNQIRMQNVEWPSYRLITDKGLCKEFHVQGNPYYYVASYTMLWGKRDREEELWQWGQIGQYWVIKGIKYQWKWNCMDILVVLFCNKAIIYIQFNIFHLTPAEQCSWFPDVCFIANIWISNTI